MNALRLAAPAAVAGIIVMSTASLAHAAVDPYPVATPKPSIAPDSADLPTDDAVDADDNGILPNTGGASVYILLAGGALLVVGGGVVYSSRRRETAAH